MVSANPSCQLISEIGENDVVPLYARGTWFLRRRISLSYFWVNIDGQIVDLDNIQLESPLELIARVMVECDDGPAEIGEIHFYGTDRDVLEPLLTSTAETFLSQWEAFRASGEYIQSGEYPLPGMKGTYHMHRPSESANITKDYVPFSGEPTYLIRKLLL
ncbi:MAG: hypothetical protein ABIG95_01760 [Candidatus Woesearchaeota archaeon]